MTMSISSAPASSRPGLDLDVAERLAAREAGRDAGDLTVEL
jgi:hypothetical protein